jgi:hypothetical protein
MKIQLYKIPKPRIVDVTQYYEFQVVIEYDQIEYYRYDSEVNFKLAIDIFKELGYSPCIITPEEIPIPKE